MDVYVCSGLRVWRTEVDFRFLPLFSLLYMLRQGLSLNPELALSPSPLAYLLLGFPVSANPT